MDDEEMTTVTREIETGKRYGRMEEAFRRFEKLKNEQLETLATAFYLKVGPNADPRNFMLVQQDRGRGIITFHFEYHTPAPRAAEHDTLCHSRMGRPCSCDYAKIDHDLSDLTNGKGDGAVLGEIRGECRHLAKAMKRYRRFLDRDRKKKEQTT